MDFGSLECSRKKTFSLPMPVLVTVTMYYMNRLYEGSIKMLLMSVILCILML